MGEREWICIKECKMLFLSSADFSYEYSLSGRINTAVGEVPLNDCARVLFLYGYYGYLKLKYIFSGLRFSDLRLRRFFLT